MGARLLLGGVVPRHHRPRHPAGSDGAAGAGAGDDRGHRQGARGEARIVATAEGNGPVNALDAALRQAIGAKFPALAGIHLTDYRVRVLDTGLGTGAVTRVLVDTSDGEDTWTTIGVSENIIEASWQALTTRSSSGCSTRPQHGNRAATHRRGGAQGGRHDRVEPDGSVAGQAPPARHHRRLRRA